MSLHIARLKFGLIAKVSKMCLVGLSFGTFIFSGIGCVSSGKHETLQKDRDQLSESLQASQNKVQALEQRSQTQAVNLEQQAQMLKELESRLGKNVSDKNRLESSLTETKKALEELARRKLESEKRISEYNSLLSKFKSLTDSGKLKVKIADGRMVVALSSDVLFGSGSAKLSTEGKAAIQEVGTLLTSIPDRKFQIEGHTDNIPIQTAQYPSNWELAGARSLTVLNAMLESGLAPTRVSAASFGEFKPAKANDTKEGRAANRRIEIVIVPDLSTLPGAEELNKITENAVGA